MRFLRRKNKYDPHNPRSHKPSDNSLYQQRLWAWRPILTPIPVIILSFLIGIIFTALGIYFFIMWAETYQTDDYRYDNQCRNYVNYQASCTMRIRIEETLNKPVFIYYKVENHYQNYRRYVASRSDWQLRGESYAVDDLEDCEPRITRGDSGRQRDVYLPCGLQANNFFRDSFVLRDRRNRTIPWQKSGIAWSEDKENKFKNPPRNARGIRIIRDFEDEDFINWMRVATFPTYLKLYGKINRDLPRGTYFIYINDRWPVRRWDGKKSIVFSETNWLGAPNLGLPICFIIVGGLSFLMGILFALKQLISPRKLGDTSLIKWDQKPKPPPKPPLWRRLLRFLGIRQNEERA